jgi:hypothetical protein
MVSEKDFARSNMSSTSTQSTRNDETRYACQPTQSASVEDTVATGTTDMLQLSTDAEKLALYEPPTATPPTMPTRLLTPATAPISTPSPHHSYVSPPKSATPSTTSPSARPATCTPKTCQAESWRGNEMLNRHVQMPSLYYPYAANCTFKTYHISSFLFIAELPYPTHTNTNTTGTEKHTSSPSQPHTLLSTPSPCSQNTWRRRCARAKSPPSPCSNALLARFIFRVSV